MPRINSLPPERWVVEIQFPRLDLCEDTPIMLATKAGKSGGPVAADERELDGWSSLGVQADLWSDNVPVLREQVEDLRVLYRVGANWRAGT
jgi:hypothetical protein